MADLLPSLSSDEEDNVKEEDEQKRSKNKKPKKKKSKTIIEDNDDDDDDDDEIQEVMDHDFTFGSTMVRNNKVYDNMQHKLGVRLFLHVNPLLFFLTLFLPTFLNEMIG